MGIALVTMMKSKIIRIKSAMTITMMIVIVMIMVMVIPITVTLEGIVIEYREVHHSKA